MILNNSSVTRVGVQCEVSGDEEEVWVKLSKFAMRMADKVDLSTQQFHSKVDVDGRVFIGWSALPKSQEASR